jgi:predicted DCC family thiol-disulfide oxidoreductase YuxK
MKLMTWAVLALELLFAPLVLFRALRPFVWLLMLSMHIGLITMINFADLSLGMVMLHLFTFNPGWLKPLRQTASNMLFYDGQCGLCHRAVRFLLAEDRAAAFRFAPLDSDAFRNAVPAERRVGLPDSAVVLTGDGTLLVKSDAWCHIMRCLGGVWKVLGVAVSILPRALRDRIYDLIASVRFRLFRTEENACPLLPRHLRERFVY